ncbi:SDR family NAD(P)-dependent oxidoreductase [Marinomonas agarivorans]|nr:SDR family NAD(P)-dependent oxidoreductase [Marinomonas agarivorans]
MSKCVLITGATSGFGLAAAEKFAQEGWSIIITGRREERLKQLAQTLSSMTSVHYYALDVRNKEAIDTMIEGLPESFKNINVLINNAGLALGRSSALESDLADWQTMIDTNITGLTNMTHALLPTLTQQKSTTVINLASVAAHYPYPGSHVYGASKAFVAQFSKSLRCDLSKHGVRVTSLEPGLAESEFSLVRFKGDQSTADTIYEDTTPLQPKDLADIMYWIATQPAHININSIEVMPLVQTWNPLHIEKH